MLADAEGSAVLTPAELAAARPDPFCRVEHPVLAHLESHHPEALAALHGHLPAALRERSDARVRPLGLDRFGLRLRVETPLRDHDVRIARDGRPSTMPELWAELRRLSGVVAPDPGAAVS